MSSPATATAEPLLRTLAPALRGLERGLRAWLDVPHHYRASTLARATLEGMANDLHRQAECHVLGRAARRARQAPAKQGTPFMPAHITAELIRRVLALLDARRPGRYPVPANPVRPGRPG